MNQDQRLFQKLGASSLNGASIPDPEVKPKKATRRQMSAKYKLSILEKTDKMLPGELGAFLRREGLYSSHLSTWRKQRAAGQLAGLEPKTRGARPKSPEARRLRELEADCARLQRRLDQAELVIQVQKKLCELFGVDPMTGEVGQVGAFVKIPLGLHNVFGVITQAGAGAAPPSVREELIGGTQDELGFRWLEVELFGETGTSSGDFRRGISQLPAIGDPVHILSQRDMSLIYGQQDNAQYVRIGILPGALSIPALIDINKLVTRHSIVAGSTGSGKSTTVAGLLNSILNSKRFPSARIILLDIHGEYDSTFGNLARNYRVKDEGVPGAQNLCIPYWALSFDEFCGVVFGTITDSDRYQLANRLLELKRESLAQNPIDGIDADDLTVDSPIPFSIHRLWFELHVAMRATHTVPPSGNQSRSSWALEKDVTTGDPIQEGSADEVIPPRFRAAQNVAGEEKIFTSNVNLAMTRQVDALAAKLKDPRYDFLLKPGPWSPDQSGKVEQDLGALIGCWLGGEPAVSILDLSGIPPAMLESLVGCLIRILFEALFWSRNLSEGGRERPLLLVMEEAHAYLGQAGGTGSHAAEALRRVVKEGRKYGIGAMLVTQRPSEIDPTVLSQCGTMIALRLTNAKDQSHIRSSSADSLGGLFDFLPILRTGEAVVSGEATCLPMRVQIDLPGPSVRPQSSDPLVFAENYPGGWNRPAGTPAEYSDVAHCWLKQSIRSHRQKEKTVGQTTR